MNKWLALATGWAVALLGFVIAAATEAQWTLILFYVFQLLAIGLFIAYLRKNVPYLILGIVVQVISIIGLVMWVD